MVPAPAIIGKANGTIDAVSGTSSLYNDIPKIISMARKKITIDPATANEFTSIPIKLRISSPTKRKEIIISAAISEAFPDYQAPLSAQEMAKYLVRFALEDGLYYNGKVLNVSSTTP